jgi:hypothetical protein
LPWGLGVFCAGPRPYDDGLAGYQRARDEAALAIYELTCDEARIEVPGEQTQQLLQAVSASRDAMDGFVRVMAGTFPAEEFFCHDNIGRIIAHALAASASVSV